MGEAKRRKKRLGEEYGKKRLTPLKADEWKKHLNKFSVAYQSYLNELQAQVLLIKEEERTAKCFQNCQQWISEYLNFYHQEDREKFAVYFLAEVYKELDFIESLENPHERAERTWNWATKAAVLFKDFQKFLSEENQEVFLAPLETFYEKVVSHFPTHNDLKDTRYCIEIKKLFEDVLEIEPTTSSVTVTSPDL